MYFGETRFMADSELTCTVPYWSRKVRGEHWQPMLTYGEAALAEVTFRGEAVAEASSVREAARIYIVI